MPATAIDLKALIVSPDPKATAAFVVAFRDLKVIALGCTDQTSASERFAQDKFEAVVVDLDNILDIIPFVKNRREGRTNRNSVVVAVASNGPAKKRASEHGASFVVERPLAEDELLPVLRAAYGFMLQDRRRYFRLVAELAVSIRTNTGSEFQCQTINVSSEGMAVRTPRSMQEGDVVGVVFAISNPSPLIVAEGTVIWDDKHGKTGLHLHFASSRDKDRVAEWLDSEFDLSRRSSAV